MRRSVDFPAPFGPMSPMRSPASTEKHTPRKSWRAPCDLERSVAVSSKGGKPRRLAGCGVEELHSQRDFADGCWDEYFCGGLCEDFFGGNAWREFFEDEAALVLIHFEDAEFGDDEVDASTTGER